MALTTLTDQGNTTPNGNGRRSLVRRLVDVNAGGLRPVMPGLVPYLPNDDVKILEADIVATTRAAVRRNLGLAENDVLPDGLVALGITETRDRLITALIGEYNKELPGTKISLSAIQLAYREVLRNIGDEYLNPNREQKVGVKLPDEIIELFRQGELFATEDFLRHIAADRVGFVAKVFGLETSDVNDLSLQYLESQAVREFQGLFKGANIALLDKLGLRLAEESDDQLSDRIDRHMRDAVTFLEQIHQSAEQLQTQRIAAWKKAPANSRSSKCPAVLSAHKPKDISFKRLSDLVELVSYANKYPIGAQRRFVAQQILVLTLLFNYIDRYPAFRMRVECARLLHNELNLVLDGRAGRSVEGVFIDEDGNKSLDESEQFCAAYHGVREFHLNSRKIASRAGPQTLFPDNGLWLGIESRCKMPPATLLKLLNKGDIKEIVDLVGIDLVIDDRNMDKDTLCRTILALKDYLKDIFKISEFVEDYTGITNPEEATNANASTSSTFVNEKVVFFYKVNGVDVPVEVQFKTLRMKLDAENKAGPDSHARYRLDQTVRRQAFGDLFPECIFGEFATIAAEVASSMQEKIRASEGFESRA
jgi:hypothetical protein